MHLLSPKRPTTPTELSAIPLPVLDRGDGPPVVILPGFALGRKAYRPLVDELADSCRAVLVELFPGDQRWEAETLRRRLVTTLDSLAIEQATVLSHSFGTGFAVELTARHPERVSELIISDSVALDRRWVLTRNALTGFDLLELSSVAAAVDFGTTILRHPLDVARAGWWAFSTERATDIATIAAHGTPCHVLWAERDTLLHRRDGREVAGRLGASFHLVTDPDGRRPLDHDWLFRQPWLVPPVLHQIGSAVATSLRGPDLERPVLLAD